MIAGLHLLRYIDTDSVVHRAGARSKIVSLTALVFGLSFDPGWSSLAVIWVTVVAGCLVARIPRGAIPRPPRLLKWSMGIALIFGVLAGGEPFVDLGPLSIGAGGLMLQLRLFGVTIGLLALALLLGWTTALRDLPSAAAWLLRPFRWLRLPVDDVVAGLALAVRALPLLADEFATTAKLFSLRPRDEKKVNRLGSAIDLVATATTSATRRAAELGEAVANRGPVIVPLRKDKWVPADAAVALGAAIAIGAIIVL